MVFLADVLQRERDELRGALEALAERERPVTAFELDLLLKAYTAGVANTEAVLRHEAAVARGAGRIHPRLARAAARVRSWFHPRIGVLRHYAPKPLCLPSAYFREEAPTPTPTISIVTPSYQQGRFLDRTLYSVIRQGYPALEYVVQDGGSTDESLDVLERFGPELAAWVSESDEGQADAINRGFTRTTGEVMGWLNSDDLLLPGSLAFVARYFAEHPDVDVVYGDRIIIDEHDAQIGVWILPVHDPKALAVADYVPQETLFWRRRIWDAAGGALDPSFRYALDWDLLLRFQEAGARIVHVPRYLGAFRVHEEQKTTATAAIGDEECERLRLRTHGRVLSRAEITEDLGRYLARHVVVHNRRRVLDRLPRRRLPVDVRPRERTLDGGRPPDRPALTTTNAT